MPRRSCAAEKGLFESPGYTSCASEGTTHILKANATEAAQQAVPPSNEGDVLQLGYSSGTFCPTIVYPAEGGFSTIVRNCYPTSTIVSFFVFVFSLQTEAMGLIAHPVKLSVQFSIKGSILGG